MTDIATLAADMKQTFEDFRAANDKRLDALEKGREDVITNEEVDRINAAMTKLQEQHDAAVAEVKAANDAIEEQAKAIARAELGGKDGEARDWKAEAVDFISGKTATPTAKVLDEDVDAYKQYADTFKAFLSGGASKAEIQAAMQVGSDPDGGYWVPTQMSSDIKRRIFETSPMRQISSVLSITTDSISFPTDTNDATSGGWVGETESRSETATPQVGEQKIYVREQYAEPRVTQKLLDMSTIDVEGWLNGKIADKMARTENTAFVSGTGVDQPRGFLDYKSAAVTTDDDSRAWGVLQYTVSGASAGFPATSGVPGSTDPNALITMHAKLKPEYRAGARWVMNRATEAYMRKMKDGDGNYLIAPITNGATGFQLLGYGITTAEDMPDLASDSFSVAFGNFSMGYQIVDGRGIRILRDNLTTKPYVKFYTTKWTGGDVVNFDAIKLMKFGTS